MIREDISEDFFCFNKLATISVKANENSYQFPIILLIEGSIQLILLLLERKNVEEIFSICTYHLFH